MNIFKTNKTNIREILIQTHNISQERKKLESKKNLTKNVKAIITSNFSAMMNSIKFTVFEE